MLWLLVCRTWSENKDKAIQAVDIVQADTIEEVRAMKNSKTMDMIGWKEIECKPLSVEDLEKYLPLGDGYFTIIEP